MMNGGISCSLPVRHRIIISRIHLPVRKDFLNMLNVPIRVLLVDDHQMVLESLQYGLQVDPRIHVVGLATDCQEMIAKTAELLPHVVVLDVNLPGKGPFDSIADLRVARPGVKILFLSGFISDVFLAQALKVRASGYLLKGGSLTELAEAIVKVAQGEQAFAPEAEQRMQRDPKTGEITLVHLSRLAELTPRQLEVLRHLVAGMTLKDIADVMNLSIKSVDSHRYRIMNKLGVHDRVELTRLAIREGLIAP